MGVYLKVKFKYPDYMYTPSALVNADTKTEADLRKEYTRLKTEIDKRLSTFEKHGETDYLTYTRNVDKYKPLTEITSKRELGNLLSEAHKMLSAKRSSYTAIKDIERESFKELIKNFPFISKRVNRKELWKFLDKAKDYFSSSKYDSEQTLLVYTYIKNTYNTYLDFNDIKRYAEAFYSYDLHGNYVGEKLTEKEKKYFDELFANKKGGKN